MSTDHTNTPGDPRDTGETSDAHVDDQTRPLPLGEPADPAPAPPTYAHPAYADEEQPRGGRHPLSISYLVAGLVFLGVAASWALRETGVVDPGGSSWLFPLTLVVVGAIGLAASVVSSARRGETG